jgi:hypothetical protein
MITGMGCKCLHEYPSCAGCVRRLVYEELEYRVMVSDNCVPVNVSNPISQNWVDNT